MKRMIKWYWNIFSNWKAKMKKIYNVICGKYRKFKKPKTSYISFFLLFAVSVRIEILKIIGLNKNI